ncbi:MAG: BON domain-containing protein [Blastocatellia bacterium]|nr:BON domain-containing protein [Blastocatellia bacterium]MBK6426185.1 BON domain-containing protein [Blastocatellia bacterium]
MLKSILMILMMSLAVVMAGCSGTTSEAPTDAKITQDIKSSFDAANIAGVEFAVANGMVTLKGTVTDQATLDKVLAIVKAIPGVSTVESQIAVNATPVAVVDPGNKDSLLMATVQQRLLADPLLAGSNITPTVSAGVVTLGGTVPSEAAKAAAEKSAKATPGVASVTNSLQVVAPAAVEAPVPDPQLEEAVSAELDKRYPDLTLFVQVKDGVVSLSGAVPDQSKIVEVTKAIHQVKGVKAVDTGRLTIKGGEPDDKRIGAPATGKPQ